MSLLSLLLLLSFHAFDAVPVFTWMQTVSNSSPLDPFVKGRYAEVEGLAFPLLNKNELFTEVVIDGRPHSLLTGPCSTDSLCHGDYSNTPAGTCLNASIYEESSRKLIGTNHLCRCEYPFGGPACNDFAQCSESCRERISNGICDVDCLVRECAYDGDDCQGTKGAPTLVPVTFYGPLVARFSFSPLYFHHFSVLLFHDLSSLFNGTAEFSMAMDGEGYLARHIDGDNATRIDFRHYADLPLTGELEMELVIDVSRCTSDCFTTVDDVIERLYRMIEKEAFVPGTPLSRLVVARSGTPCCIPPSSGVNPMMIVAIFVLLIVLLRVIYYQRESKKKTIDAPSSNVL